jgi:hypothetical protein
MTTTAEQAMLLNKPVLTTSPVVENEETKEVSTEVLVEPKTKIFIFMAQDGRVGKTTACKMFIHNLQENLKKSPIIVDTDPMNPNVARSYTPGLMKSWNSNSFDQEKGVDRFRRSNNNKSAPNILEVTTDEGKIAKILSQQIVFDGQHHLGLNILALTEFGRDVVVNVSGNTHLQLCSFLAKQEADKAEDFDLHICWVTNGSKESLDLFIKTQERFDGAEYLLIFNEGNTQYIKDWDNYYLTPEIAKLDQAGKIKLVSLPFLSVPSEFWDEHQNIPYTQWLTDESLSKYLCGSIKVWIDAACKSLDNALCP